MAAFPGHTFQSQHSSTDQIRGLQNAIQENTRLLAEVKRKRLCTEEEIIRCRAETVRRVNLMIEKGDVVDELVQLGRLLQEEKHLSEQLNGQDSVERDQNNDLQERSERITKKAESLAAEIREVKEQLAETKARNMAAQALIQAPAEKSKRHQNKPK
ncbi:uncharacterized protein LOC144388817 [Gasterosteus aculeatus]